MSKGAILVVEDETIIAEDLADKLRLLGYDVVAICVSGDQAVAAAERLRPDLVLMDIRIEGPMDGVEAAELIRTRCDLPVIYLTAHADSATLGRAKLTQPFGYILKPFDEQILSIQLELALYKHRAERELRNQREWLRITLSSIADAVLATDTGGRVTFVNPVAASLMRLDTGDAVGKPVAEVLRLVDEQTHLPVEDPVQMVLRDCSPVALSNHSALVTNDGSQVPVEDAAAPMLDGNGQVIGAVLVFRDVTERRRAADALKASLEKLREAQDELVRRERLSTLGRLAGGVAHELRTPLTIIRNSLYYLKQATTEVEGIAREVFEEANRAIASCDHIIGEMLDFVREPSAETSVFRIGDAIQRALRLVPMPRSVSLVQTDAADGMQVRANEDQVIRILANLILNAVQAMPNGGELKIEATPLEGNKVCVAILDTGCGIPEENLSRIFDPLFTTKTKGIGLGLSVCQRYARLNGAELSAESVAGAGAVFRLTLERCPN